MIKQLDMYCLSIIESIQFIQLNTRNDWKDFIGTNFYRLYCEEKKFSTMTSEFTIISSDRTLIRPGAAMLLCF